VLKEVNIVSSKKKWSITEAEEREFQDFIDSKYGGPFIIASLMMAFLVVVLFGWGIVQFICWIL
jgi:hypothetical protein